MTMSFKSILSYAREIPIYYYQWLKKQVLILWVPPLAVAIKLNTDAIKLNTDGCKYLTNEKASFEGLFCDQDGRWLLVTMERWC